MNLLEEKWLPVRRNTGQIDWVAPHQIAEPDIVAFEAKTKLWLRFGGKQDSNASRVAMI